MVTLIVLCLQHNQTPLELAVKEGHSEVVYYFVKDLKMDSVSGQLSERMNYRNKLYALKLA